MDVNGFIAKSNHEKNVNLSADVTNLVTEMANVIAAGSGSVGYAIVLVVVAHVVLVIGRIWHVRFALAVARATETTGASSTDYAADLAAAVEVVLMVLRLSDFSWSAIRREIGLFFLNLSDIGGKTGPGGGGGCDGGGAPRRHRPRHRRPHRRRRHLDGGTELSRQRTTPPAWAFWPGSASRHRHLLSGCWSRLLRCGGHPTPTPRPWRCRRSAPNRRPGSDRGDPNDDPADRSATVVGAGAAVAAAAVAGAAVAGRRPAEALAYCCHLCRTPVPLDWKFQR